FTVINTLFLNPIPASRPSELVAVFALDAKNPTQFGNLLPLSYPNLQDLRAQNVVLSDLAGYSGPLAIRMSIADWGSRIADARSTPNPPSAIGNPQFGYVEPERVFAQLVTANYFDVLGLTPAAGRFFVADEDRTPGSRPVIVIAHSLWQRRFGADA